MSITLQIQLHVSKLTFARPPRRQDHGDVIKQRRIEYVLPTTHAVIFATYTLRATAWTHLVDSQ